MQLGRRWHILLCLGRYLSQCLVSNSSGCVCFSVPWDRELCVVKVRLRLSDLLLCVILVRVPQHTFRRTGQDFSLTGRGPLLLSRLMQRRQLRKTPPRERNILPLHVTRTPKRNVAATTRLWICHIVLESLKNTPPTSFSFVFFFFFH